MARIIAFDDNGQLTPKALRWQGPRGAERSEASHEYLLSVNNAKPTALAQTNSLIIAWYLYRILEIFKGNKNDRR